MKKYDFKKWAGSGKTTPERSQKTAFLLPIPVTGICGNITELYTVFRFLDLAAGRPSGAGFLLSALTCTGSGRSADMIR